ncbi:MAG TPA: HAD family phosphatase [Candidatus Binatia bacterium]|nr:HAD family phosphatase [Candidatus Binatia bacterium]
MITTAIFDLDGLLADTEPLHCRAYQLALFEHGVQLTAEDYGDHWVRCGKGIHEWLRQHSFDLDPMVLRARKAIHYQDLLQSSLRAMDGAEALLDRLAGNMRIGLASSSYRDAVDGVIHGLGIANYFDTIVSGLDVARVKPAPDIFLEAAHRLGVDPAECAVLEDAEKGVLAAHAAGMRCVAVPNDFTQDHDFSKATCVCSSLNDVTFKLLRNLRSTFLG